ncbi:Uncharacterised protein [uncultured archaeon]|nr:Uncharacterised protein [uncultured archaeon]
MISRAIRLFFPWTSFERPFRSIIRTLFSSVPIPPWPTSLATTKSRSEACMASSALAKSSSQVTPVSALKPTILRSGKAARTALMIFLVGLSLRTRSWPDLIFPWLASRV